MPLHWDAQCLKETFQVSHLIQYGDQAPRLMWPVPFIQECLQAYLEVFQCLCFSESISCECTHLATLLINILMRMATSQKECSAAGKASQGCNHRTEDQKCDVLIGRSSVVQLQVETPSLQIDSLLYQQRQQKWYQLDSRRSPSVYVTMTQSQHVHVAMQDTGYDVYPRPDHRVKLMRIEAMMPWPTELGLIGPIADNYDWPFVEPGLSPQAPVMASVPVLWIQASLPKCPLLFLWINIVSQLSDQCLVLRADCAATMSEALANLHHTEIRAPYLPKESKAAVDFRPSNFHLLPVIKHGALR